MFVAATVGVAWGLYCARKNALLVEWKRLILERGMIVDKLRLAASKELREDLHIALGRADHACEEAEKAFRQHLSDHGC